jgi:hypothetical protein
LKAWTVTLRDLEAWAPIRGLDATLAIMVMAGDKMGGVGRGEVAERKRECANRQECRSVLIENNTRRRRPPGNFLQRDCQLPLTQGKNASPGR